MKNSLTITRYRVFGKSLSALSIHDLDKCLQKYVAPPFKLRPDFGEETSFGWKIPEIPEDLESGSGGKQGIFDTSLCQIPGGLNLQFRVEFKKIPSSLLNLIFKERLNELLAEQELRKPSKSTISKINRREIKEEIKSELYQRALPEVKFFHMVWYSERNEIVVDTAVKKYLEIFEKLFFQTFYKPLGIELVKIVPLFHVPLKISGDIANIDGYDRALGESVIELNIMS